MNVFRLLVHKLSRKLLRFLMIKMFKIIIFSEDRGFSLDKKISVKHHRIGMKKIFVSICKYVVFKCNYLNWNCKNSLLNDKRGRVGSLNCPV